MIQKDLQLTDFQTGSLYTVFICCYMVISPVAGWVSDHQYIPRKYLMTVGVITWSLATGFTALCYNYYTLLLCRALFGLGEAIFATLSTPFLSDLFPIDQRSWVLALFNVAVPVGVAANYMIGGVLSNVLGWRGTFGLLSGMGLIGVFLPLVKEPVVGANEDVDLLLNNPTLLNKTYILTVAGLAAMTFATGGLADWLPTFFYRYYNLDIGISGIINGCQMICGGLTGTLIGGFLMRYNNRKEFAFLLSGFTVVLSAMLGTIALIYKCSSIVVITILFASATFFASWYIGPINGVLQNVLHPLIRARGNGLCILMIHMLGDSISPSLIGLFSDKTGGDLRHTLLIVPLMLIISGIIWLLQARTLLVANISIYI